MFWYHYADLVNISDDSTFNDTTWEMNDHWWSNCSAAKYIKEYRQDDLEAIIEEIRSASNPY